MEVEAEAGVGEEDETLFGVVRFEKFSCGDRARVTRASRRPA
jgi:hypothetical protein